ncbi:hypothetical protein [Streptomyces sp. URMC 129]|uniref:hypothetical protein n=1 Tax=Streptomyces sp. URMC 129 TaxID=3423407 RepID=UPI003F1B91D2
MTHPLRQVIGILVVLAGIGFAAWLVFAAPDDWDGAMDVVRIALGSAALGIVGLGARLVFPDEAGSR